MEKNALPKLHVFTAMTPYRGMLQVYNRQNFDQNNRNSSTQNIYRALGVSIFAAAMPIIILLGICHFFDNNASIGVVIIAVPIMENFYKEL